MVKRYTAEMEMAIITMGKAHKTGSSCTSLSLRVFCRSSHFNSFDRHAGPYTSRRQSLRSNTQVPVEQIPPLAHINSFGRPGQEGTSQFHDSRRVPEAGLQRRGYATRPGNVQDHYNYNSDPNSESSSFGGSNNTSPHEYDVNFGDVSLQLELSNQLDGQIHTNGSGQYRKMIPGSGNPYADGYPSPVDGQSQNPNRHSTISSPSQGPYHNGDHAGNGEVSGNSLMMDSDGGQTSASRYSSPQFLGGGVNKESVLAEPAKAPPPAPVKKEKAPEPVIKKKVGLLKRLSKT